MNRSSSPFSISYTHSPNPFKPAIQYLQTASGWHPRPSTNGVLDGLETSNHFSDMSHQRLNTHDVGATPLINFSPSPSPYSRRNPSSLPSDDEDDDLDYISAGRPLVPSDPGSRGRSWKRIFYGGELGNWLFGTCEGWQVYVGLLTFWILGCGFGLVLMNRFILWSMGFNFHFSPPPSANISSIWKVQFY